MPGVRFEQKIRRIIDNHLLKSNIRGVAKRRVMSRWTKQEIDLTVDSPHPEWYMAIECKGRTVKKTPVTLQFSSLFHKEQIETMRNYIWKSGRRGFLAVELGFTVNRRTGEMVNPNRRGIYIIDWKDVLSRYDAGDTSFKLLGDGEIPNIQLKKTDEDEYNVEEAFKICQNLNGYHTELERK